MADPLWVLFLSFSLFGLVAAIILWVSLEKECKICQKGSQLNVRSRATRETKRGGRGNATSA